jgi:hypothetical protein
MQFVWLVVAGAILAWAYLAILGGLLFSPRARRMPPLLAMVGFLEGTAILLTILSLLSAGSIERLAAALAGFLAARAVLGRRLFGPAEAEDLVLGRQRRARLGQQPLDRLA